MKKLKVVTVVGTRPEIIRLSRVLAKLDQYMDHILIHDDKHLRQVVNEYTTYFNRERPHQGIDQRIPDQYELPRSKPTSGHITSKAFLGGLHHSYSRTTYLN